MLLRFLTYWAVVLFDFLGGRVNLASVGETN